MSYSDDFAFMSAASLAKVLSRLRRIIFTVTPSFLPCDALYASTTFCIASPSGPGHRTIFTVVAAFAVGNTAKPITKLSAETSAIEIFLMRITLPSHSSIRR